MNMAFTAGCFFILQCIFLMDISVADPLIDVSPSAITLGVTSTLDINCTFSINNHPDLAALASLVLSRANATGQTFEDLAAISEFSPDSVTLLTKEKVLATGVNSQIGETFLHLTWQYPTALQGGVYRCSAYGLDNIGRNVEMTNISSVTVDEANLNDIFDKLQQLEMHEASMEQQIQTLENEKLAMKHNIQNLENDKISKEQRIQTLEDKTQTLENDKISMEEQIAYLERNNSYLEGAVALLLKYAILVDYLGNHDNSSYYVSNYAFVNVNQSMEVCRLLGGQLAVIDNYSEFTAIAQFLRSTTGIDDVYIAGSDEGSEGNWVLPDSYQPMPFTYWKSGYPRNNRDVNCVMLYASFSWSMGDYFCRMDPPSNNIRYMCELSTV